MIKEVNLNDLDVLNEVDETGEGCIFDWIGKENSNSSLKKCKDTLKILK